MSYIAMHARDGQKRDKLAGIRGQLAGLRYALLRPLRDLQIRRWTPELRACIAEADPDGPAPGPVGAGPLARETRPQPVLDQVPLVRRWSPENTWTGAAE